MLFFIKTVPFFSNVKLKITVFRPTIVKSFPLPPWTPLPIRITGVPSVSSPPREKSTLPLYQFFSNSVFFKNRILYFSSFSKLVLPSGRFQLSFQFYILLPHYCSKSYFALLIYIGMSSPCPFSSPF